jgi:maltose alpha-D-glucosyltransferase/alpha-amylase
MMEPAILKDFVTGWIILHALGLDTIWLAPFQPTPNRDNGYDISDFYGVDPRHGSSGDFVDFIHKARKLGIKVIIDLVVNHTSDEHRWFKEARSSKDNAQTRLVCVVGQTTF